MNISLRKDSNCSVGQAYHCKLTVFLVTQPGRFSLFQSCCLSVLDALPKQSEVRVIVNGSDQQIEQWLGQLAEDRLHWKVVSKEPRTVSRNRAFSESQGETIYFLDDDVVVPWHLFRSALREFDKDDELAILGGPNITPKESSFRQRLFGAVMTSGFAAPYVRRRYGASVFKNKRPVSEKDLILCNLALRQSHIPKDLKFHSRLKSNEENLFLFACYHSKLKLKFCDQLFVYHHRRKTLASFGEQIYSYGFGRAQQTILAPGSLHLTFAVPGLCCLGVMGAVFLEPLRYLVCFLAMAHMGLSFVGAVVSKEIRKMGLGAAFLCVPLTMFVHLVYGLGFLIGLGRNIVRRMEPHQMPPPVIESEHRLPVT